MNFVKFPLEILIKVKTEKLKILKEKLQEAKLKGSVLEAQLKEAEQKKREFEEEIRKERVHGNLKNGAKNDFYLLSIKEKLQTLASEKNSLDQRILKNQEEILAILLEKKRFEKLKEKRFLKAKRNVQYYD